MRLGRPLGAVIGTDTLLLTVDLVFWCYAVGVAILSLYPKVSSEVASLDDSQQEN